jgi:homoserine kinase
VSLFECLEKFQMENNLKKVISDLNKSRGLGSEGAAAAGGSAEGNPISKVPMKSLLIFFYTAQ